TFSAFICAIVKGVNGASLPPTKNLLAIPLFSHATPLRRECKAVEQVMEWDISGPWVCRSWATQEDIFPKVVVGEDKVEASPFWINSLWYFSKRAVAPLEEPMFTPKRPSSHPARPMASLAVAM